jgi:hypothetical protein
MESMKKRKAFSFFKAPGKESISADDKFKSFEML